MFCTIEAIWCIAWCKVSELLLFFGGPVFTQPEAARASADPRLQLALGDVAQRPRPRRAWAAPAPAFPRPRFFKEFKRCVPLFYVKVQKFDFICKITHVSNFTRCLFSFSLVFFFGENNFTGESTGGPKNLRTCRGRSPCEVAV